MIVRIPSHVECRDGPCGDLMVVTVAIATRTLTHLVVNEHAELEHLHLIPFELVKESSERDMQLDCTTQYLKGLPNFVVREYVRKPIPPTLHGSDEYLLISAEDEFVHLQIPSGEVVLSRTAKIKLDVGTLGTLQGLAVDPTSGKIMQIIVHQEYLWRQKDILLPVERIKRIEPNVIYADLDKRQFNAKALALI